MVAAYNWSADAEKTDCDIPVVIAEPAG